MAPVQAIGLMTIQGQVTDPVGDAVVGAALTDGHQTVYSDASGRYRLEESSVQNYVVRISRQGFEGTSRTVSPVDALGSVDFSLFYLHAADVSPRAFNNVPPKTLAITARSYAPLDSCVNWTDATSSTLVALQLSQGVPGGQSTWTGSFAVPGGIPDASYAYSSVVIDCATSTALSRTVAGAYIVDGAAPALTMIAPLDGGNTLFTSQPIVAVAQELSAGSPAETGSGVDPA
ncbi:MAG: carboxypeptidase regulatory-like domain-containing protein, partial [Acidobacteria bacterium]|nr:carboxypeptidase regulatory-like domain-containing protein [Acidobacteriota bacterium]